MDKKLYLDWFNSSDLLLPLKEINDITEITAQENYVLSRGVFLVLGMNQEFWDNYTANWDAERKAKLKPVEKVFDEYNEKFKIGLNLESKEDFFERINKLLLIINTLICHTVALGSSDVRQHNFLACRIIFYLVILDNLTSVKEDLLKTLIKEHEKVFPEGIDLLSIIRRVKSKIFKYWSQSKITPRTINNVWNKLLDEYSGIDKTLEERFVQQALQIKHHRIVKEYCFKFAEVSYDMKILREKVENGEMTEDQHNHEAQKFIPKEVFEVKNKDFRQKGSREYIPIGIYKCLYTDYNNNYNKFAVTEAPNAKEKKKK